MDAYSDAARLSEPAAQMNDQLTAYIFALRDLPEQDGIRIAKSAAHDFVVLLCDQATRSQHARVALQEISIMCQSGLMGSRVS